MRPKFPPPHILKAALDVLYFAAVSTRNWTLNEGTVSRKQINDLWEALHNVPDLLSRWKDDSETELIMYLSEYSRKWNHPNLLERYNFAKKEAAGDG